MYRPSVLGSQLHITSVSCGLGSIESPSSSHMDGKRNNDDRISRVSDCDRMSDVGHRGADPIETRC
jgi:hypothetical protein